MKVVLETYESTADVPGHAYEELLYKRWGSGGTKPYVDWDGRDARHLDTQGGVMCGHWAADNEWHSGENNPC